MKYRYSHLGDDEEPPINQEDQDCDEDDYSDAKYDDDCDYAAEVYFRSLIYRH